MNASQTADVELENLVAVVVGCAQLVLRRLGPSRTRRAYIHAVVDEFGRRRIPFQVAAKLPLFRNGVRLDAHRVVELCVFGRVVVDVVAVDRIRAEHCTDLHRRLCTTGIAIGLVVNFASARLLLGRVVVRHIGAFCLSGRTPEMARQNSCVGLPVEPPVLGQIGLR